MWGRKGKEVLIFRVELLGTFEKILQKDFHGACGWVEIDLHIHLVTTEYIILDGMHPHYAERQCHFQQDE